MTAPRTCCLLMPIMRCLGRIKVVKIQLALEWEYH
jgi:hypothetical protein